LVGATLRRLFLPPRAAEPMTEARVRTLAWVRIALASFAIVSNLMLYRSLDVPGMAQAPEIRRIMLIDAALLACDLVITAGLLRSMSRAYYPLLVVCLAIEMLTEILWISVTGLVSSHMLMLGTMMIVFYRLMFGYRVGLFSWAFLVALHAGAFGLESVGYLPYSPIRPDSIYGVPEFRATAMFSIVSCYLVIFGGANFLTSVLSAKDRALVRARKEVDRVREQGLLGRLSGTVLLGLYEIGEVLGRGGVGEVYEARRLSDGRAVALKVLHLHHEEHEDVRERFRREATLAAKLPRTYVPELLEFGTSEEGYPFIAMERLRGEDLGSRLRREGLLDLDDLLDLVRQLSPALDAAHALGIVHRDLKPQNVFLVENGGGVRLLDFGVARLLEHGRDQSLTRGVVGTPGYLAPEQVCGDSHSLGPQTDVFALGAIVYRALTGKNAFSSRELAAAVHEVLNATPTPPSRVRPELPPDLDLVIARALAKRKEQRYARAGELAADLEQAIANRLSDEARRLAVAVESAAVDKTLTRTTVS
jgi:serine/threonine-protein kinase